MFAFRQKQVGYICIFSQIFPFVTSQTLWFLKHEVFSTKSSASKINMLLYYIIDHQLQYSEVLLLSEPQGCGFDHQHILQTWQEVR